MNKTSSGGTTEVRKWELEKVESELLSAGYDATEGLLNFMQEKEFELWLTSDEYKKFNSLLIKTGTDFDDQYKLYQPMRTFFTIRSAVTDAQELYLREAIGKDLLKFFIEIVGADADLVEIIAYLKKALAFFSIRRCTEHFNVRFSDAGFTILNAGK
jgi:hypothetical protein